MGWSDGLRNAVLNWLMAADMPEPERQRLRDALNLRAYAQGQHKRQLKVKAGGGDDNITVNWSGLVIARGISLLYGPGVTFTLEDERAQEWLDTVWLANKQAQLLYRLAEFGGTYGTSFVKIIPDGLRYKGADYPRLVAINPLWMRIDAQDEDYEKVERYICEYAFVEDSKTFTRREVTERVHAYEEQEGQPDPIETEETAGWTVTRYIKGPQATRFEQDGDPVEWPYTFAPILHWQNMPDSESQYGRSDIGDIGELQDRYNFVTGNVSKIIRNHAHPKTFGKGLGNLAGASWGADEMITASDPAADVKNIEMASDLASSRAFAQDLRQSIFDLTRTPDTSSLADKAGQLTNFGLRILFMDALNKNDTKRSLYGDALTELNRRLLVVGGQAGEDDADGGAVNWQAPLPENDFEESQYIAQDVGLGLVSKETASGKRGYDWTAEQEKMSAERAGAETVGALALRSFLQGGQ